MATFRNAGMALTKRSTRFADFVTLGETLARRRRWFEASAEHIEGDFKLICFKRPTESVKPKLFTDSRYAGVVNDLCWKCRVSVGSHAVVATNDGGAGFAMSDGRFDVVKRVTWKKEMKFDCLPDFPKIRVIEEEGSDGPRHP